MKQKALTDYGSLEFEDKCPVYHWKWDSAISPLDITFKMDEEVEYFDKFINENTKIISSQSGNKLVTTSKNSYGTWVTTSTFTDSFCIMVSFTFYMFWNDNVFMIFFFHFRNVLLLDLICHPWSSFWKNVKEIDKRKKSFLLQKSLSFPLKLFKST